MCLLSLLPQLSIEVCMVGSQYLGIQIDLVVGCWCPLLCVYWEGVLNLWVLFFLSLIQWFPVGVFS